MRNFIVPDYTGDSVDPFFLKRDPSAPFQTSVSWQVYMGFPETLSHLYKIPFSFPHLSAAPPSPCLAQYQVNLYTLRQGNVTILLLHYAAKQGSSPCQTKAAITQLPGVLSP